MERWLERLYIAAEGARLRNEDRRKAREVAALLDEIGRGICRFSRRSPIVLVDAAAGKSYVGLLAAKLVLDVSERRGRVITIERNPACVSASRLAAERLESVTTIECRGADVAEAAAWPEDASIVVALHACGAAADNIIGRTIAVHARISSCPLLYKRGDDCSGLCGKGGRASGNPPPCAGPPAVHSGYG